MSQLIPIQLEDGITIYIEATENMETPLLGTPEPTREQTRTSKGGTDNRQRQMVPGFQKIEDTIRAYTHYALNAFKQVAIANVNKVTLEFGIQVNLEAGIPYVTKGTAESNLKITVECTFPDNSLKHP
ncbi:MAG: hypothetical protein HC866_22120 [Leptolyngbyaceae cyanobacterium RU_5_1]|nr:hypothetical protein [Leptolyngbyaceae cyanobacterium RU_5_1]